MSEQESFWGKPEENLGKGEQLRGLYSMITWAEQIGDEDVRTILASMLDQMTSTKEKERDLSFFVSLANDAAQLLKREYFVLNTALTGEILALFTSMIEPKPYQAKGFEYAEFREGNDVRRTLDGMESVLKVRAVRVIQYFDLVEHQDGSLEMHSGPGGQLAYVARDEDEIEYVLPIRYLDQWEPMGHTDCLGFNNYFVESNPHLFQKSSI